MLISKIKKIDNGRVLTGDSQVKDAGGQIVSISTPQWSGDIRIIDPTHFEMREAGGDGWSWAFHIAQADDYILQALAAKGILKDNKRFFKMTKDEVSNAEKANLLKGEIQHYQGMISKGVQGYDDLLKKAKMELNQLESSYIQHSKDAKTVVEYKGYSITQMDDYMTVVWEGNRQIKSFKGAGASVLQQAKDWIDYMGDRSKTKDNTAILKAGATITFPYKGQDIQGKVIDVDASANKVIIYDVVNLAKPDESFHVEVDKVSGNKMNIYRM